MQQRTAEQLFKTLGELKGGAMKFGRALSVLEAALPDELVAPYRANLTKLQDDAPPMPTQTVRDQLENDLGPTRKKQLVWLDGGPTAAASIGQVHKGRWSDGRDVAVKVQYPGAGEALMGDLRQLARPAKGIAPVFPGIDIKPLVAELQARAADELDYSLEAEAQRAFAEAFLDDPDFVVPDVVASGEKVLVTEWLESPYSLAHVIREGTQEERNHYGELLARFLFSGPARTGMLHADPHPGNFRPIPETGQLGVLDFGAVARLPERHLPRDGHADPGRARRRARPAGRRAARGGLHQGQREGRPAARPRLPLAVHRAGARRELPLQPPVDADAVRADQQPARPRLHDRHQAQPADELPADPPHSARRPRPAQPARGGGAVPRDPRGEPSGVRGLTR
ncbi:AarF/UbiB family protein [Nocardioides sp. B-3]|uniref:AarF/UbiB family protein n=1 Tax=Nocardioides sp. B-3 TaxID=2895565 RepID=UPI00215358DF|nr:AarF/UbiB family protein [Nocardioides sp. B-3]UUZ60372.1 AarF/UbiB family protein [Nocardioides sp. B-3]